MANQSEPFRPRKMRASLAAPPTALEKENVGERRKRSQSMGGPGLASHMGDSELSPRKKARRSLVGHALPRLVTGSEMTLRPSVSGQVPGRSILKPRNSVSANSYETADQTTTIITANSTDNATPTSDLVEDIATTMTDFEGRKSLARRVSFAPTAHMRSVFSMLPVLKLTCSRLKANLKRMPMSQIRRSSILRPIHLRIAPPRTSPKNNAR
jgi:hypothetical protein